MACEFEAYEVSRICLTCVLADQKLKITRTIHYTDIYHLQTEKTFCYKGLSSLAIKMVILFLSPCWTPTTSLYFTVLLFFVTHFKCLNCRRITNQNTACPDQDCTFCSIRGAYEFPGMQIEQNRKGNGGITIGIRALLEEGAYVGTSLLTTFSIVQVLLWAFNQLSMSG